MKATLEFNLPDDEREFKIATQSNEMHSMIWNMDQWLRAKTKYAPDSMSEDTYNAFEACRESLHDFINENNINLEA